MAEDTPADAGERRLRREQDPAQLRWIAQARSLAATLDLLPTPIVLFGDGEPLRVWHANAAARHRLGGGAGLHLREGTVQGTPEALHALRRATGEALRLGPGHPQALALAADARAAGTVQALGFGASADLPVSELLMLEMRDGGGRSQGLQRLCAEFGLTPREAEVAVGLYSMGSIEELARCTGRSVHTVRTQVKVAMQKTGRRTQAGLVAAVADRLSAAL
jgi:DNA-binding CsgD family transcriptional regulator